MRWITREKVKVDRAGGSDLLRIDEAAPDVALGDVGQDVLEELARLRVAYDGVGNLIKQTYPSAQTYERRHDQVDRLSTVKSGYGGSTFAEFKHAGQGTRRLQRDYTPSGGSTMRQLLEDDGERRVVSLEPYLPSSTDTGSVHAQAHPSWGGPAF